MLTLSLVLSLSAAHAEEPVPASDSHIIESYHAGSSGIVTGQTMAVVLWCQPTGDLGQRIGYLDTRFEAESTALVAALDKRAALDVIVAMNNPTSSEVNAWLTGQVTALGGDVYREILITIACPATGGDIDEEFLWTREVADPNMEGLRFADIVAGIGKIAASSVWLLDASRDLTAATGDVTTLGPTADDIAKLGLTDALVISSSPPGKYGGEGLVSTVTQVIEASEGGPLTLDSFYYQGVKRIAPLRLELSTSLGTPGDGWTGLGDRKILEGSDLIVTTVETEQPKVPKRPLKLEPSYALVAGGGAAIVAGGVFALVAKGHYDTLAEFDRVGGESQSELEAEAGAYRTTSGLAIGLGTVGVLATAGGIAWTVIEGGDATVTLGPSGTGVKMTGSW